MKSEITDYIDEIKFYPKLSPKEEKELFERLNNGEKEVFIKIFNNNLKFVVYVASKYFKIPCSLSKMDMINEGNLGLIKAINKYRLDKNTKFTTFAYDWINNEIDRAIKNNGYTIRIPVDRHNSYSVYEATKEKLERELGRNVSREEIYNNLNMSLNELEGLKKTENLKNVNSLNALLGNQLLGNYKKAELSYYVSNDELDCLDNIILEETKRERTDLINKMLNNSQLTKKQIKIILLKLGFVDGIPKSYTEVGKILNASKQSVQNLFNRGMEKLQNSKYKSILSEYYFSDKVLKK